MAIIPQQRKSRADKLSKTLILDPYETKESRCRIHWSGNKSPLPPALWFSLLFIEPAPLEVHSCPSSPTFNLLPDLVLQALLLLLLFGSYSSPLSRNIQGFETPRTIQPTTAAPVVYVAKRHTDQ